MAKPRLHLIAPAGSCREFLAASGFETPENLIAFVQEAVGDELSVTGDGALIAANEDELTGGRDDDRARATDIEEALACEDVAALAAIRGGAWLTRVLPHVDFTVLDRRTQPVAIFGFSEITSLINIVASHTMGRGVYDNAPAFLVYGLRRYAETHATQECLGGLSAKAWARAQLLPQFRAYFQDLANMVTGAGTERRVTARLVQGDLAQETDAVFVGGNLTVLTSLVASRFRDAVDPDGRWVLIEDYNDKPGRLDRMLATLTLAGFWGSCAGVLLGDFHLAHTPLTEAVVCALGYHLPPHRRIPVLVTSDVGHIWPMSPLPLHATLRVQRGAGNTWSITWPAEMLHTASPRRAVAPPSG